MSQVDTDRWASYEHGMQVAIPPPKEIAIQGVDRKPKFLDDLENFLNRELQSLGVETVQPNETRLQVCVQVYALLLNYAILRSGGLCS